MISRFKIDYKKQTTVLILSSLFGVNVSALNLFVTGGLGTNFIYDHNTSQYRFKPAPMDVTVLAGLGVDTPVNSFSNVGVGLRYIYNDAGGEVNSRGSQTSNTSYKNKIDNILTTVEARVEPFRIRNSNLTYGVRGGVGVNTYRMQLTGSNVGGAAGLNINPERTWKTTPAGLIGFSLTKNRSTYGISGSLDYIYLGKQTSNKQSRTVATNDLVDAATFHNHNIVLSLTYSFKEIV